MTAIGDEVLWLCPSLDDTGNGTTTVYDLAGSHDMTLNNTETGDWISDIRNGGIRSLILDGTNEYGTVADSSDLSFVGGSPDLPFTVSMWFTLDANPSVAGLIGKASSFNAGEWVMYLSSGTIVFRCIDDSAASFIGRVTGVVAAQAVKLTQSYYHVLVTYSGSGASSGIKIYLNGVQADISDAASGTYSGMENLTTPLYVAARGTSNTLPGNIDDIRLFNRVVTSDEIKTLCAMRTGRVTAGGIIANPGFGGGFNG